ncbi:hypothetical protein [Pseudooceanicola sp.]|uniref:hypothetical protein n=1 Tax=Pseudooceanicola sp. TaxID=1914328 RepID=UPI00261B8C06|nr:hypothetical protein [Pseudooceanicola sp.]MDF1856332.1 hypothetical protein [Pseudooceanicola sp.]
MNGPLIIVWVAVLILGYFVWRREGPRGLRAGAASAAGISKTLVLRLPLALLAASFLVQIVPIEPMSRLIGPTSGVIGIFIASLLGGLLPGGPMTSFPIAIVFIEGGAGIPQMVGLIGGWSVFALHRLLAYEAPIMGWRFVALRLGSCLILPLLAGLITEVIVAVTPLG